MSSAALTDNKEASEKAAAPQASATPQAPAAPKNNRPRIIAIVAGVAVGIGAFVYLSHRGKESTDDAFIEGHIVQISPKIAERVDKVLVDDNAIVKAGDPSWSSIRSTTWPSSPRPRRTSPPRRPSSSRPRRS